MIWQFYPFPKGWKFGCAEHLDTETQTLASKFMYIGPFQFHWYGKPKKDIDWWLIRDRIWNILAKVVKWGSIIAVPTLITMCMNAAMNLQVAEKRNFYDECLRDHKQYECDYMYTTMQAANTPIYVPLVIPMGR